MNRKVILAVASVLCTLGLAVFALHTQGVGPVTSSELNASLGMDLPLDAGNHSNVDSSYELSAHQTLSRVVLLIREHYVDPARIEPYAMFLAALNHIQKTVPEVMVDDSEAPERIRVAVGAEERVFDLGGLDQLWEVTMALRDIFRFMQTHITDSEERRDIEYAAINGMLSTLDPHSILLKPESFNEVKMSTKGEFGGLGIVISIRDGSLTIISPIEGTPASRAGLKAKDKIAKIGEESTVNMGLEEAVQHLRGKPGTKVAIWVLRKGWSEPKRFMLTRAIIKIESVTSELLDDGVGYIRIKSFQNNTYDDLHAHLQRLKRKLGNELSGLVLDLRNNPGGLLDQAILISDRFIERGPLVITVGEGRKKREVKSARFAGSETDYPIAVLVNGGSASASEIVAGALQNHDRAVVIGQQTFGKGSVQVLYDFKDNSALKLTIAQYLTPGDISIQSVGITPDIEIVPATITKERIHLFAERETLREKDLDKHLDRHARSSEPEQEKRRSAVRIFHHEAEPDPPGDEADTEVDEVDPNMFTYDFETRLAHDVLAKAQSTKRKSIIAAGADIFSRHTKEQNGAIAKGLNAIGLDWADGTLSADKRAALSFDINGAARSKVMAGEIIKINAALVNEGNQTLYRAYAVSKSDNPLLNNLEFAFGRVDPQQTKRWTVEVKLPKDISPRADMMSLTFGAGDGTKVGRDDSDSDDAPRAYLDIEAAPGPRFAYVLHLDDSKGNGDGVLQVGEPVKLSIDVTNVGTGTSEETQLSVKNLSGKSLFLDRGRDRLEAIEPGASKTGTVKFTVRGSDEAVKVRVSLWDSTVGAHMSEVAELPVLPSRRARPEVRGLKVKKAGPEVPVYAGASELMPILGYAKPGATLRSNATFSGKWARIEVKPGLPGFVRMEQVSVLKSARRQARSAVRILAGKGQPELQLELGSLLVTGPTMQLKGSVKAQQALRDVFVFVNDKKTFYRSLSDLKPKDGVVSVDIDVPLTLKDGSNGIAVIVRQSDDLMTREVFGVYREHQNAVSAIVPKGRNAAQ